MNSYYILGINRIVCLPDSKQDKTSGIVVKEIHCQTVESTCLVGLSDHFDTRTDWAEPNVL